MTSNHEMPRPWLAGVCAWIAWKLRFNVIGVRAVVVLMLCMAPVVITVSYLCCALCLGLLMDDEPEQQADPESKPDPAPETDLGRRIDTMEQRLADFDREMARRG